MDIFISWSGDRSRFVASALKTWIADVFLDVRPWMSAHDIEAGARWGAELEAKLEASNFGILCLTPENLDAAWLLYEAGSLAKAVGKTRVVPYRVDVKVTDVAGPLAQFQGVAADEPGSLKLLQSVNDLREEPLENERLRRLFAKWWPDLQAQLAAVPALQTTAAVPRSDRSLLEEILEGIRRLQRPSFQIAVASDRLFSSLRNLQDENLPFLALPMCDAGVDVAERGWEEGGSLLSRALVAEMQRRAVRPNPKEGEKGREGADTPSGS